MYVYKIIDIHKSKCEYEKKRKETKVSVQKGCYHYPAACDDLIFTFLSHSLDWQKDLLLQSEKVDSCCEV